MAKVKKADTTRGFIAKSKAKRPGRHAKTESITNKRSKRYKKPYRGQGGKR